MALERDSFASAPGLIGMVRNAFKSRNRAPPLPACAARVACVAWTLLFGPSWATIAPPAAQTAAVPSAQHEPDADEELAEILVETQGPRFVAPTRRDSIGRIWAPVYINGKGPFRLVLDTGATQSGLTAQVAQLLGLALDASPPVMLRGVTGSATVPTVRVGTLSIGDLLIDGQVLPIVPDVMGGAEGILGTAGLTNKRILIDFRHDQIVITYSHGERSHGDFISVPFRSMGGTMIMIDAHVGSVRTKAIIDTGGQMTIANLALRDALARQSSQFKGKPDQIIGATRDIQNGEIIATPVIQFGSMQIRDSGVTFADVYIFSHWRLTREPAILIGMDALGLLDTLIIDYRRQELQIRTLKGG
jgi:hypothetical protein